MARIYLSSTFEDLREQREAVSSALRRLGHEDVAMEYYVAEDRRPLDKCLADVRSCDVYIGIFAWRYGFVPETGGPDGFSFTEHEYRCAAEAGKTCLIFLLSEDAAWPRSKMDRDSRRIDALREGLKDSGRVIDTFETTEELARKVNEAVVAWERESGLVGDREPADWHEYRAAVTDRHRWVRLQVIAGVGRERDPIRIPLTEVFEPQFVMAGTSGTDVPDEIRQYQQEIYGIRASEADPSDAELLAGSPERVLDVLSRERTQVFLGGPGAGKSTLSQYAMLRMCEPAEEGDSVPRYLSGEPVPFVVELRGYVLEKDPDFLSYLARRARDFYGVPLDVGGIGKALTEEGKAIVFFDGLDEVFDPDGRRRVIDQFQAFARKYPGCRIVVTSRIAGYDRTSLGLAGFQHYTLMPLTIAHIRNFAGRWYRHYTLEGTSRTAEGLVQRIAESPRLLDLAGNPMLLTMMAVIYKDRDLPTERWRLYQRCAETLLEDWDLGKGIKNDDFNLAVAIRTSQKSEMLQRVAMYMLDHAQAGSELNAIAYAPLQKMLAGYLTEKYQRSEGDAEAIAVDILKHLMERTYVLAGVGERIFGFVHRTFMEYFAACRCLAEFNARSADFGWLKNEIFGAHWQDPAWEEVLLLLIAMLHDQGTPITDVVEHLRHAGSERHSYRSEYYPYHVAFAARCLGEISAPGEQRTGRRILTELAKDIAEFGADSRSSRSRAFTETALRAFSALAAVIEPPDEVTDIIAGFGREATSTTQKVVAWQAGFALRSRKERLDYALAALKGSAEAVRRGAIAALEREWPGRADLAPRLAEVVARDTNGGVRLAALSALERSWPHDSAVLDAIEEQAGKELSYEVGDRFIRYLEANWPGSDRALRLIMKVADNVSDRDRRAYYAAAAVTARGWPHDPDAVGFIHKMVVTADVPEVGSRILRAWARERARDSRVLSPLREWAVSDDTTRVRSAALQALVEVWEEDPNIAGFVRSRIVDDAEASVRIAGLRKITRSWPRYSEDARSFVRDRAVNDPDPKVREEIFISLLSSPASDLDFVKDHIARDTAASVRTAVLVHMVRTLPLRTLGFSFIQSQAACDPDATVRAAVLRSITESGLVSPNATVRAVVLWSITKSGLISQDGIREWFEERAARDPDPDTRAVARAALDAFVSDPR